jgi:hypothetical protein
MQFSRLKALVISILFCVGLAIATPALSVTLPLAQTPEPQATETPIPENPETQPRDRTETDQPSAPEITAPEAASKPSNQKGLYDPEAIKAFDRELYGTE